MEQHSEKKIEQLLQSLDGTRQATAPDFFYTRLYARMEKELQVEKPVFFLLRPSFLLTGLALFCLLNLMVLLNGSGIIKDKAPQQQGIESVASEYNLTGTGQLYE